MLLTRKDIAQIYQTLCSFNQTYNKEFKYFVKRNKDLFIDVINAIDEVGKTDIEEFEKYEKERLEKISECVERDEKENPIFVDTQRGIPKIRPDKKVELEVFMNNLQVRYSDVLRKRTEEIEKHNDFLSKEVEIVVYQIDNSDIPEEIDQPSYEILFPLIKEKE